MPRSAEIIEFYRATDEDTRLTRGIGPLELARTMLILSEYLPKQPVTILDVGGGPGTYSFWMTRQGHKVHLVDLTPEHIEQVKEKERTEQTYLAGKTVGDARNLDFDDEFADVVLLHGPLYHLQESEERNRCLQEAYRVLVKGGHLFAFGISYTASTLVGLVRGWIWDGDYLQMIEQEISTRLHTRPDSWPQLFVDGYFHHPNELEREITQAGFKVERSLAIEGPTWLVPDFEESWANPQKREVILKVAKLLERDAYHSPHFVVIATKQGQVN